MSSRKTPLIDSDEYYGIRILRDGTWLYGGTAIKRHNLVKLFASVLKRDEQGDFWLQTPYEKGRIEVEDAPFTAVELRAEGAGEGQTLQLRTNLDEWVTLDAAHPLRIETDEKTGAPSPYVLVRDNLEARIARSVYYELAALAVPSAADAGTLGVWSAQTFYPLGSAQ
jgi:hypothetical protein